MGYKIWWYRKKILNLHRKREGKQFLLVSRNDSVAQLVEQMTLNHWVVGSSPTGVTTRKRQDAAKH